MDPLVDVALITYNHAPFIREGAESILRQQTTFSVRLIIGDDCSTDGTREIAWEYMERYPHSVLGLLQDKNLGLDANPSNTSLIFEACKAKYMALLEGDDYWTDPLKLQKQVDFLESHPEASMCFHKACSVHEEGLRDDILLGPPIAKPFYTAEDLLRHCCFIPTASMMFRRRCLEPIPEWYHRAAGGDWSIAVICGMQGPIGFLDEVMSVHRAHSGGVYWGKSQIEQLEMHVQMHDLFLDVLPAKYRRCIRSALAEHCYRLALAYARSNRDAKARGAALSGLLNSVQRPSMLPKNLSALLRLSLPHVFGEIGVDRNSRPS